MTRFIQLDLRFWDSNRSFKLLLTLVLSGLLPTDFDGLREGLKRFLGIILLEWASGMEVAGDFMRILLFVIRRRLFLWKITLRTYRSIIFTFALTSLHITLPKLQLHPTFPPPILQASQTKLSTGLWFCQNLSWSYFAAFSLLIYFWQNHHALNYERGTIGILSRLSLSSLTNNRMPKLITPCVGVLTDVAAVSSLAVLNWKYWVRLRGCRNGCLGGMEAAGTCLLPLSIAEF